MKNTENVKTKVNETACCGTDCCEENESLENGLLENESIDINDNMQIKSVVKEQYGKIASQSKTENETSCCGTGCCETVDYAVFAEDYTKLKGYNPDADLGLGCGMPTEFAQIKEGDTVVDLGSGAGNDVFIARAIAGEKGKVIGVDFTEKMIRKARENNMKSGFNNVEFRYGDIESLPVLENEADVIISNCVLNLVPDKAKAFSEIYRVLKPGGHLSVSDIVTSGELPERIRSAANMYAGCVGGAVEKDEYINIMGNSGLANIQIQKEKVINIPDEILSGYLSPAELSSFRSSGIKILSVNVYAEKSE